jgi:hypothetical protein
MHRNRWYRHGDVHYLGKHGLPKTATPQERFWAKVDAEGDCWIWTGAIGTHGYGVFRVDGKAVTAHRYSYESLVGKIADGLTIDHLCRNRPCLNPDHLEAVTQMENNRRVPAGLRSASARGLKPPRTECKRGHPLSGENLYVVPNSGHRSCRTCAKQRVLDFHARLREQKQAA